MKLGSEIAIGELSRRTECNIETIRYYERIGLLPQPHRQGGRFRRYDADDVARLRFIRRARQLGFTLDEVRALMRLAHTNGDQVRAEVRSLAAAHVAEIRAKITDLQAMERVRGRVRKTLLRGRIVFDDGVLSERSSGRLIVGRQTGASLERES